MATLYLWEFYFYIRKCARNSLNPAILVSLDPEPYLALFFGPKQKVSIKINIYKKILRIRFRLTTKQGEDIVNIFHVTKTIAVSGHW